jgi:hypothetical protein
MRTYNNFKELVAANNTSAQSQITVFNTGDYYTERKYQTSEMKTPESKKRIAELKQQVSEIEDKWRQEYSQILREFGGIVRGDVPEKVIFEEKMQHICDEATELLTPIVKELREYHVFLQGFKHGNLAMSRWVFPSQIR